MAELVFAAGVPHAPGLAGLMDTAPAATQDKVREMYARLADELRAARPDVLIIFANDHLANSRVRSYPDFLVGAASQHSGPYEWFKEWIKCRDYAVPGNPQVAHALVNGLAKRGIRSFWQDDNLKFDDNISIPVVMTGLDSSGITLVPVLQNCIVPPVPDQRRCYAVGQALGAFIREDLPADLRVGLLGSGGLSHEPGGARYYFIDEEFDTHFLDLCARGDHARLLQEMSIARMDRSGAGGTAELLAWFVVMGATGPVAGENLGYVVHRDFKCGIGGVIWRLQERAAAPTGASLAQQDAPEGAALRFDPTLAVHDLIQDLKWSPALRAEFASDEQAVLARYALRPEERRAIEARNFRQLYDLGLHPYLGGQLARLIYGNEAGKGAKKAVDELVRSLRGGTDPDQDDGWTKR